MVKTHKRKKSSRNHGKNMGTAGTGARKNKRKSGHHGGAGMSGSGKRADHKKTLVIKLHGHNYFGKKGFTSRGTKRDTRQRINIFTIEANLDVLGKKTTKGFTVDLKDYKVLATGEVKNKLIITAKEASVGAIAKVEAAGGQIILPAKKEEKVVAKKEDAKAEVKVSEKKPVKKKAAAKKK